MDFNTMKNKVDKSPLFGIKDAHGQDFDDIKICQEKELIFPSQIIVHKGAIIDRIALAYGNTIPVHGGSGGTRRTFDLQEGEHITRVSGNTANFGGQWVIGNIAFYTDKGRSFEQGRPVRDGSYFEYAVQSGKAVLGLYGRAGQYFGCIGFYERDIDLKIGEMLPGMKTFGL